MKKFFQLLMAASLDVWLASSSKGVRIDKHFQDLNQSCLSPLVIDALRHIPGNANPENDDDRIYCIMRIENISVVHPMMSLLPHEREQLRFWQAISGVDLFLNGMAVRYQTSHTDKLDVQISMHDYATRSRFRGLVVRLEENQVDRLSHQLEAQGLEAWMGVASPTVAIRLPRPYAELCCRRRWPSFILPHVSHGIRGGSHPLSTSWKMLGIRQIDLPPPPVGLQNLPAQPQLTADIASMSAEHLRDYAMHIDAGGDEFQMDQYINITQCVHTLQTFADDMDPVAYHRAALDVRGRSSLSSENGERKCGKYAYKVAFILQAFLLAQLLKPGNDFHEVICDSLKLALPKALHEPILALVQDSPSTTRRLSKKYNFTLAGPCRWCAHVVQQKTI